VASLRTVHADGSVERGQPISAKPPLLTVLPGELAEIEVRIATRELQAKNADRLITMALATDSPNGFYLSLEVHIYVETPFFVVPTTLSLGRVPVSGGGDGKVEIVPAGAKTHQLKELEPLPEGVHAELTLEQRNGMPVWTLRAGFDPPLALGPLTTTLRIATEDYEGKPGRPVEVPMAAQAVPDLAAEPERLVFACAGDAGGSATTELGSLLAGQRLRVLAVEVPEVDRAYLSAEFAPVEADDAGTSLRWRISLAARSPLPDKDLITGQLLVRLDDPQHPSVPLDFVIHRKK
jgi:hypothetical protein